MVQGDTLQRIISLSSQVNPCYKQSMTFSMLFIIFGIIGLVVVGFLVAAVAIYAGSAGGVSDARENWQKYDDDH